MTPSYSIPKNLRRFEREATTIRKAAGISPDAPFDVNSAADRLGLEVLVADAAGVHDCAAKPMDGKTWSAMSRPLPDGRTFIMLNPNQTKERANVSILEEYAHVHYGHTPTPVGGPEGRVYDEKVEAEAYQTAAAVLLPSAVIAKAVWRRRTAEDIAAKYGASTELFEMRVKLLGLWNEYQQYAYAEEAEQ